MWILDPLSATNNKSKVVTKNFVLFSPTSCQYTLTLVCDWFDREITWHRCHKKVTYFACCLEISALYNTTLFVTSPKNRNILARTRKCLAKLNSAWGLRLSQVHSSNLKTHRKIYNENEMKISIENYSIGLRHDNR